MTISIKYAINGRTAKTFTNGKNDFIVTIRVLRALGATIKCQIIGRVKGNA